MLLDLNETDDLSLLKSRIDKDIFDCSLDVKKLLFNSTSSSDSGARPVDHKGVRLPKIDVDGECFGNSSKSLYNLVLTYLIQKN